MQLALICQEQFALHVILHVSHVRDLQQAVYNAHLDNTLTAQNAINANVTVSPAQVELLASPVK